MINRSHNLSTSLIENITFTKLLGRWARGESFNYFSGSFNN